MERPVETILEAGEDGGVRLSKQRRVTYDSQSACRSDDSRDGTQQRRRLRRRVRGVASMQVDSSLTSTCHVIIDESLFKTLETACEEEDDMLDLAFSLTPTSRLGCQIK